MPAFTGTTEIHHLFGLLVPGFKPRESEKFTGILRVVQLNPVPVFGAKKYQYHLTEIFYRNFCTNGKRSQTTLEIHVSQNLVKLGGGGP